MPLRSFFTQLFRASADPSANPPTDLPALDSELAQQAQYQGLNFYSAIQSHQAWKRRLVHYVQGQSSEALDPQQVRCDTCCELGDWLHNRAQVPHKYFGLFQRLIDEHAQFHQAAAKVVTLAQNGQREQALRAVTQGEFARQSAKVVASLSELYLGVTEEQQGQSRH